MLKTYLYTHKIQTNFCHGICLFLAAPNKVIEDDQTHLQLASPRYF